MTTHSNPLHANQGLSGLPLFDWRNAVVRKPATKAGQYLLSRYSLPPGHADLIAALAGIGGVTER